MGVIKIENIEMVCKVGFESRVMKMAANICASRIHNPKISTNRIQQVAITRSSMFALL